MIRKSTWIVMAVFAILLLVMVYWQRTQGEAEPEATPTSASIPLLELGDVSFAAIEIKGDQGETLRLERDGNGAWSLIEPQAETGIDVAAVDSAATQLRSLTTLTEIESVPDMEVLGLASPAYVVTIKLDDGRVIRLDVGKVAPTGSGYYVLTGDGSVVLVSKYGMEAFLAILSDPPVLPTQMPTLAGTETPIPTPE